MNKDYDIKIIVTHRCNAKCIMCDIHNNQTKLNEEININTLRKLPSCREITVTGGEPFLREDIEEIVALLCEKSKRVMINTNGFFTEKIASLYRQFPNVGIRVSLDGDNETHDRIRGIAVYKHAIETLETLKKLGGRDVGISYTLQESNYDQIMDVYHMSKDMGVECSISIVLNSFAFYKYNNLICNFNLIESVLKDLISEHLKSKRIKDWGRAFFYDGMIRYLRCERLPVRCNAGIDTFFLDVYGNVLPCNATKEPLIMGNLNDQDWNNIITSNASRNIIKICQNCKTPCWAMCNMKTVLRKKKWLIIKWVMDRGIK